MTSIKSYILRPSEFGSDTTPGIAEKMTNQCEVVTTETQKDADGCFVFRWGSTATIKRGGLQPFYEANKPAAHKKVGDKGRFRRELYLSGLSMPTFLDVDGLIDFGDGFVLRPMKHKQGQGFHHHFTYEGVKRRAEQYSEYYICPYIDKDREFRVQCANGRVVYVYEKTPTYSNQETWGSEDSNEKMLDWSAWPMNVVDTAVRSMELSGLDYGAVDVITKGSMAYVLEINTAPDLRSEYRQGKIAKIFDHMITNGFDQIHITSKSSWKNYIHPAISDLAI